MKSLTIPICLLLVATTSLRWAQTVIACALPFGMSSAVAFSDKAMFAVTETTSETHCSLAASSVAADETDAIASPDVVQKWLELLGSASFADRQQATRELTKLGSTALPAVRLLLGNEDREVRTRAEMIVTQVERQLLLRRLDEFSSSQDPDSFNMPMWAPFAELVGRSHAAQATFAMMLRSEHDLLRAVDSARYGAQVDVSLIVNQRIDELQTDSDERLANASLGTAATLLFLVCQTDLSLHEANREIPVSLVYSDEFSREIVGSFRKQVLSKLIEQAVVLNEKVTPQVAILIGQRLEIRSCLPRAEAMLADATQTPYFRQRAMEAITTLGDESTIPQLEKYLDDATVLNSNRSKDRVETTTTLGDFANAACIYLAKGNYAKLGFERIQTNQAQSLFAIASIGFPSEAKRLQAREAWRAYRKNPTK
jgi:hypothetical protein